MERPLNYHHLHYFKVIAEFMSITEAALTLGLAPSTLSDQLKTFEAELGVVLIERKPRMRLTREGRIVLEHARAIVSEGNRLRLRLGKRGLTEPMKFLIDQNVPEGFARSIIFHLRCLKVSGLEIHRLGGDPARELRSQSFDLALVSNFLLDGSFEGLFLGERFLSVCVSPDLKSDLTGCTVILPPPSTPEGKSAESWLRKGVINDSHSIVCDTPQSFLTGRNELVFSFEVPSGYKVIDRLEVACRRIQIVRPAGEGSGIVSEIFSLLRRGKISLGLP